MRQYVEHASYQPRPSLAELTHAPAALGRIGDRAGGILEHRVVSAGTEGGAFAGDYQHAAFAIVADGMQMALEVEDHGSIEAIAALGPIEGDGRDRTVTLDEKIFCGRTRLHSCCFTAARRWRATVRLGSIGNLEWIAVRILALAKVQTVFRFYLAEFCAALHERFARCGYIRRKENEFRGPASDLGGAVVQRDAASAGVEFLPAGLVRFFLQAQHFAIEAGQRGHVAGKYNDALDREIHNNPVLRLGDDKGTKFIARCGSAQSACAAAIDVERSLFSRSPARRGGRVVEGTRLLIWRTGYPVPRVRIPPSPPVLLGFFRSESLF